MPSRASLALALAAVALLSASRATPHRAPAPPASPAPSTPSAHVDTAAAAPASMLQAQVAGLSRLAPSANPQVLAMALSAMQCAQAAGTGRDAQRLAVIDYSRSSLLPRLWVFDLGAGKLLHEEWVAHGQGSGGDLPDRFSNAEGSHQSSLGLFHTLDTYQGRNGYSLRMDGLEPGINDAALPRAIVMHGADYVNPANNRGMGRLGRSWGCPAVRSAVAKPVIDSLKRGQFLFSYYPDPRWLRESPYAGCLAQAAAHAGLEPPRRERH